MKSTNAFDETAKRFFSDNQIFADVFNYLLYNGESVIKADDLVPYSTETVIKNGEKLDKRLRDLLNEATIKEDGKNYYMLLGIEHQSTSEFFMIERVLNYEASQLLNQAENAKKGRLLKRVITIVIYTGEKEWKDPRSLYDTLSIPPSLMNWFNEFMPNRRLPLLDIRHIEDEAIERLGEPFSTIASLMKYQDNKAKVQEIYKEKEKVIYNLQSRQMEALKKFTKIEDIDYIKDEGEVTNMRSLSDTLKDIGRDEGSFNAYYNCVKGAMQNLGISVDKAIETLKVPQEHREAILKKIKG